MQTTKVGKRTSIQDMTIVVRKYEKNSDREEVLKIFRDGMILQYHFYHIKLQMDMLLSLLLKKI